ncbi:MAG: hypothetical protein JXQ73_20240 [Phycisphaerae bacterium]|nr:hypothetical protein [Phycisphaerae bacterium]
MIRSLRGSAGVWTALCLVALIPVSALGDSGTAVAKADGQADSAGLNDKINQLESLLKAQQDKIGALQNQVDSLEAESTDATRVAEVRKVVQELMADSGFRESLYPDVQQVGYDKGFYIKSSDETFLLKIGGYMHIRYTGQNRQTDNRRLQGRQKQDDINGFEIEDLFLIFTGHIHDPKLTYNITVYGDTDNQHDWRTYYAYVNYALMPEVQFLAGLVKVPFGRQELVSKSALQFVDRSMANEFFNLDRTIGAAVHGTLAKKLSYVVAVANGVANPNDSPSLDQLDTNFAYATRLVANILGGPINGESDLAYSKDPQLEVGFSFGYNDDNGDRNPGAWYSIPDRIRSGRGIGGNAVADLTGTDYFQFGTDAAFRYRGFSATAEYWLRTIDGNSEFSAWELQTGRSDASHQQGGYLQAGYFVIPKKLEMAARLGGVWDNNGDNCWEYAFGVNYFPWSSWNAVVQADFTRMSEAPSSSSAANWSQNDEVNMVRIQLQVKF